jgi:hypothetical protein
MVGSRLSVSGITIAGIDVSRNKVTVCVLNELPADLKRFKAKWRRLEFKADREGIADLLALDFHGAIMEPTGGHYSRIWAHHLQKAGKVVRWVGHQEIAAYRESWKVFNKSDRNDAIALACYGLERWQHPQFFLSYRQADLLLVYLQLEHLNRVKNPIINRIRQQLCHELPEVSESEVNRPWMVANPPGLWRAIAGEKTTKHWEEIFAGTIGTGLTSFTRNEARMLCEIERQEYELEQKLSELLTAPEYQPYLEVFKKYAIAERTSAALLSAIYPIRRFLVDGREQIEHVITENGKRARRNHSLSKFKLSCGLGMVWYQSGNTSKWVPGGRDDIRRALWRWCKTAVVMKPKTELHEIKRLREYYDRGSDQMVNGELKHYDPGIRNQKVMRVVRRMLERLYRDLLSVG